MGRIQSQESTDENVNGNWLTMPQNGTCLIRTRLLRKLRRSRNHSNPADSVAVAAVQEPVRAEEATAPRPALASN